MTRVGRPPWAAAGPLAGFPAPRTRPRVLVGRGCQPGSYRISLNVGANSLDFLAVSHEMIIALFLPERSPGQAEYLVGSLGGDALQRAQRFGHRHLRCEQYMDVIRHDHKC